jgi:hypothetical protein
VLGVRRVGPSLEPLPGSQRERAVRLVLILQPSRCTMRSAWRQPQRGCRRAMWRRTRSGRRRVEGPRGAALGDAVLTRDADRPGARSEDSLRSSLQAHVWIDVSRKTGLRRTGHHAHRRSTDALSPSNLVRQVGHNHQWAAARFSGLLSNGNSRRQRPHLCVEPMSRSSGPASTGDETVPAGTDQAAGLEGMTLPSVMLGRGVEPQ